MITKIQSFTDVITNSSSTVFVMNYDTANYYQDLEQTEDYVSFEPINFEWLQDHPEEVEMVCDFLGVSPSEVTVEKEWGTYTYWEDPELKAWEEFLFKYKDQLEEVFKDLYWVNIDDNFEDAYDIINEAADDAKWVDYRH